LGNPATRTDAAAMARELKPDVFCFCTLLHIRSAEPEAEIGFDPFRLRTPQAEKPPPPVPRNQRDAGDGIAAIPSSQRTSAAKRRMVWVSAVMSFVRTTMPSPSRG
jgi:hypothetical protein